ncbi:MAG: radical SAM protein [Halobacteriota archaeon]|nr:radical SAM protein [Halobacteriota archaeon]
MPEEVGERYDHFIITSPPLSILALGTYLDAKGVDVRIIDMELDYGLPLSENGEKHLIRRFIDDISLDKIDWIGFTTTTPDHCQASLNLSEVVKDTDPDIPIIFGGYHATINAEELLKRYACIDAIVTGEGERASLNIHGRIVNGQSISTPKIKNLAFRNDGNVVFSEREPLIDLSEIPPLKFDLLDNIDKYIIVSLLSSRGCPFNCGYCVEKAMRSRHRFEPFEKIVQQIETMQELNSARNMIIQDPLFGLNAKRIRKIYKAIKDGGYSFGYETRADVLPASMIPEIRDAGGEVMFLGLESASMNTLLRMNKFSGEDRYERYITNAKKVLDMSFKHDITPMLSIMLGYPGDTIEDLNTTVNFLNTLLENHKKHFPCEDDGVGLIIYPHVVSIIPQSQIFYQLEEYKKKGLSYSDGGLFRFTKVNNPSSSLNSSTVLNYLNEVKKLSMITPTMMDRMMRLMWCDLKKMLDINSELSEDDCILTGRAYQEYNENNEKLLNANLINN